ncbi:hypothetical protein D3C84_259400 [compost metagenome]
MSKLVTFKAAERALAIYYRELQEMKDDPELKRELEFDADLTELLEKYKVSRETLLDILKMDSQNEKKIAGAKLSSLSGAPSTASTKALARSKQKFPLRTYLNPHNGVEIKIRLGTDSKFKEWVKEYGKETVESWKTAVED